LAQEREDDAQRVMMEGQELLQALSIHVPEEFRERFMGRAVFGALPRQQDSSTVPTPEDEPLSGSRGQEKEAASRPSGFESILGDAQSLVKTLEEASKLAAVDADIMLRGESGTGKELLATALVKLSGRADKPFVRVNAAALSDELLQSELFGHVKGAFTGAHRTTQGKLEEAHTGTLFLDEVGELSPRAQVMLLRVLQERKFQKLGSPKEVTIDVRILFATNANLEDKVRSGAFRGDLYHRISGLELHVPPLRERGGDIRLLAESFLTSCNQRYGAKSRFSEPSIRKATEASWPGNVRELKNRVEKAFIMREGEVVHLHSGLNPEIGKASNGTQEISNLVGGSPHGSLDTTLKKVERQLIENALNETSGNISRAAKLLGMSRPRLSQKVKEYGLKKGEKREK
jgi:DNA-binding NtrC family response regulator